MVPEVDESRKAVLFDFDGTIGDTETPAMKVAFWEIAPFLLDADADSLESRQESYVRNNAGKAFEFMLEACEESRKEAGLPPIEDARKSQRDKAVEDLVDIQREKLGLLPLKQTSYPTLLEMQKVETVISLSKVAQPVEGILHTLELLTEKKIPFAISTTSPKPRVPVSIESCGLSRFFPAEKVHSGESDFDPPRFKPAPDVYLRAAAHEGALPSNCIAVEDSESGVGSAANAGIGFIVGYVGASHIPVEKREKHSSSLLFCSRSASGRGADIVIVDMNQLPKLVMKFVEEGAASAVVERAGELNIEGGYYLKDSGGKVSYFD